MQSREMGTKKSSEPKWLAAHIGIYVITLVLGSFWLWEHLDLGFYFLIGAIHAVQDWCIWKGYKWLVHIRLGCGTTVRLRELEEEHVANYEYWEDRWFYATIGLDQVLHVMTILVIYGLFTS